MKLVCLYLLSRSAVSDSLQPHGQSPPGSSVHEIFQARILEWVAISFSRASRQSRNRTHVLLHLLRWQVDSLLLCHLGGPNEAYCLQTRIRGRRSLCPGAPQSPAWFQYQLPSFTIDGFGKQHVQGWRVGVFHVQCLCLKQRFPQVVSSVIFPMSFFHLQQL